MSVESVVDVCCSNLFRLYDEEAGGFFFGVNGKGLVDGRKDLRYNIRVVDLLHDYLKSEVVGSTVSFIECKINRVLDGCLGDTGSYTSFIKSGQGRA